MSEATVCAGAVCASRECAGKPTGVSRCGPAARARLQASLVTSRARVMGVSGLARDEEA